MKILILRIILRKLQNYKKNYKNHAILRIRILVNTSPGLQLLLLSLPAIPSHAVSFLFYHLSPLLFGSSFSHLSFWCPLQCFHIFLLSPIFLLIMWLMYVHLVFLKLSSLDKVLFFLSVCCCLFFQARRFPKFTGGIYFGTFCTWIEHHSSSGSFSNIWHC